MRRSITTALLALTVAAATFSTAHAQDPSRIWFPIQVTPELQYSDTWGAARGSRSHTGVDLMNRQMAEVYAAAAGTIYAYEGDCRVGEYCHSFYLLLSGDDGRSYFYVHLNNDTPGRPNGCDGIGGVDNAFSPRLAEHWKRHGTLKGVRVAKGEHIAYNGSSGNAGCGVDHVHFEIWDGHGWGSPKVNPYPWVREAHEAGNVWGEDGAPPEPVATDRVAGDERIGTALALSQRAFDAAQSVVIAPAFVYPEALLAAPLASLLDAPVLLTFDQATDDRGVLDQRVAAEIERLGASYAVLIGAHDRLGPSLEDEIAAQTSITRASIRRIQGADRYELSREVAEEVLAARGVAVESGDPSTQSVLPVTRAQASDSEEPSSISPVLALGEHEDPNRGWPDALAASVLAARQQVPVLLTRGHDLPPATREVLDNEHVGEVRIAGGPAAISEEVEASVRDDHGKTTRRLDGPTRYATALSIAGEYAGSDGVSLDELFVATGRNFPDALAAGNALAELGRVLVLVDGERSDASGETYEWIRDRAGSIHGVTAVGGSAAVSAGVLDMVARYANWPRS